MEFGEICQLSWLKYGMTSEQRRLEILEPADDTSNGTGVDCFVSVSNSIWKRCLMVRLLVLGLFGERAPHEFCSIGPLTCGLREIDIHATY